MPGRLREIDTASGVTISLVVFGHMSFLSKGGIEWYDSLWHFIYQFHMNAFYFLAGFLFYYSKDVNGESYSHSKFVRTKIIKFSFPYLFFAFLFFIGEFAFAENKSYFIEKLPFNLYLLFFEPIKSFPTFLWFLYVLLLFYISIPLLLKIVKTELRKYLFLPALLLIYINWPGFLSLNLYAKYLPWFLAGIMYKDNRNIINRHLKKFGLYYFILLILIFIFELHFFQLHKIIVSSIAIPSILWISIFEGKISNLFAKIGMNSFPIYLQNMTIVGIVYLILTKILKFDVHVLQFFVPLFFILSISIPLILRDLSILNYRFIFMKRFLGYMD